MPMCIYEKLPDLFELKMGRENFNVTSVTAGVERDVEACIDDFKEKYGDDRLETWNTGWRCELGWLR